MERLTKYSNDIIRNKAVNILRKLDSENGLNGDELAIVSSFCLIERMENKELKKYEDLEEQGKLLKLPCKAGDTAYYLDRFCSGSSLDCPSRPCESCEDFKLEIYEGEFKLNDINDFGKTVFLTRQEAEDKLAEMEGKK